MAADYRLIIGFVRHHEGGWSDHPADRALNFPGVRAELEGFQRDAAIRALTGGRLIHTNKGVIWSTWKHAVSLGLARGGYREFLTMTTETWLAIFKRLYWDAVRGDEILVQEAANVLADFAYGSGPGLAVRITQQVLNRQFGERLAEDGAMGPLTLAAINRAHRALVHPLVEARAALMRQLASRDPSQQVFIRGWLSRVYAQLPDWAKKRLPRRAGS